MENEDFVKTLSLRQFAKKIGITVAVLRYHIKRGRIRVTTREVLGIRADEEWRWKAYRAGYLKENGDISETIDPSLLIHQQKFRYTNDANPRHKDANGKRRKIQSRII